VGEYKEFKDLKRPNQNLRDHMSDWELIFTMVGEKASTDITRTRDAKGFDECKSSARRGGQIAENARKELEQETGEKVVSKENFLQLSKKKSVEKKK
jgi:DNA-damage-inducible protein D